MAYKDLQFTLCPTLFQGVMIYEVIGTGAAPSFFYVGGSGQIYTRGTLSSDRALDYTVRTYLQF